MSIYDDGSERQSTWDLNNCEDELYKGSSDDADDDEDD